MMLRVVALAALVSMATATCAHMEGVSALVGTKCGAAVDQTVGRSGWITKLNVYSNGKCITGIKATYGYDAKGAKLLGKQGGAESDFKVYPASGEFINKVQLVAGSCVEAISFSTTKGRTYSAGKPGSGKAVTLTPPTAAAHVYAFKGFFSSNCAAPAISIVWATEGCPAPAAKAATVPLPAEAQAEAPTPVEAEAQAPAEAVAAPPSAAEAVAQVPVAAEAPAAVEAPAEVEAPKAAAEPCEPVVILSGSHGLACDLATSKVVATGLLSKFSPFINLACQDLQECSDAAPASDDAAYAKCKWAVCKPSRKLNGLVPAHPDLKPLVNEVVAGINAFAAAAAVKPADTDGKGSLAFLVSKLPTIPIISLPALPSFPAGLLPAVPSIPVVSSLKPNLPNITLPNFGDLTSKFVPNFTLPDVSSLVPAKPNITALIPTTPASVAKPDLNALLAKIPSTPSIPGLDKLANLTHPLLSAVSS